MTFMGSLPADVKAVMRIGFNRSVEMNSNTLTTELRRPRDALKDWSEGVGCGSLKALTPFQLSVRLLRVLQELEATEETDKDAEGNVTAVLTAELHIFKLNCHFPLRYNPFLAHWVNTAAAIQSSGPAEAISLPWKAQLEIIRLALTSPGVEEGLTERGSKNMEKRSPESIVEKAGRDGVQFIELAPFVDMMRAQGLPVESAVASYVAGGVGGLMGLSLGGGGGGVKGLAHEDLFRNLLQRADDEVKHRRAKESLSSNISAAVENQATSVPVPPRPQEPAPQPHLPDSLSKGKAPAPSPLPITSRTPLPAIHRALEADPAETTRALTRLPLDLPSLDLLTHLLTSPTPPPNLDTATLTREYIQHCLRLIERSGSLMSPNSSEHDEHDTSELDIPMGREEQIRAVRLLVMFMRNLLRQGKLPVEELAFDLEEVCVRYLWIAEVREFKRVLEGGDMVEMGTGGMGVGG